MKARVKDFKSNITELNRDVEELCRDNEEFADRIDQLERQGNATTQYGHTNNVIISGISNEVRPDALETFTIKILSAIGVTITAEDIEGCHRHHHHQRRLFASATEKGN